MNNCLKAVSTTDTEMRVSNYMILFGGRDLTGEYFTSSTEIESSYTKSGFLHVDFEHGLDPDGMDMSSDDVLGYIDWKTARIDERGVFVERVLNRQARYMEYLEPLIEAGAVGTSSESISGKSVRAEDGMITKWPLKRDTLTFTPAEPRMITENVLNSAKSLQEQLPHVKSLARITDQRHTKSAIEGADSYKEIERILRDVGRFSRSDATMLVSRVKSLVQSESEAEKEQATDVSEAFKRFKL